MPNSSTCSRIPANQAARIAIRLKTNRPIATPAECGTTDAPWLKVTNLIRKGDPAALATLYNRFFETVFNEVRRVTGCDESTCLDLTHDTFLNVIRRIKPIESEEHLQGWIRTVARTTTYDWLRRETRDLQRLQRRWEQKPKLSTSDNSTVNVNADLLDDSQARMLLLQEQLESMPVELQEMISLRYRLGWSLARIGQRFGLKTGAVDGRIRRAMNKIRLQIYEGNHA